MVSVAVVVAAESLLIAQSVAFSYFLHFDDPVSPTRARHHLPVTLLFSFYSIQFDAASPVHFLAAVFVVFQAFQALKRS